MLLIYLLFLKSVDSFVDIHDTKINRTIERYQSIPASFGSSFDIRERYYLVEAKPLNACTKYIKSPPSNLSCIALIKRGTCRFSIKVLAAQSSGYAGVIVFNVENTIFSMQKDHTNGEIKIPSVMVGLTDGQEMLHEYTYNLSQDRYQVSVTGYSQFNPEMYILAFLSFVSVGFIIIGIGFGVRLCRDIWKQRANRLRKCHLKKIPVKKFKKGEDRYETCAICLEDYEDGDKLRVLFCGHAYHMCCIDPWLLKQKRNCPICKAKIHIPGVHQGTDENPEEPSTPTPVSIDRTPTEGRVSQESDVTVHEASVQQPDNSCGADNDSVILEVRAGDRRGSNTSVMLGTDESSPLIPPNQSGKFVGIDNRSFQYAATDSPDVAIVSGSNNKDQENAPRTSILANSLQIEKVPTEGQSTNQSPPRSSSHPPINNFSNDIVIRSSTEIPKPTEQDDDNIRDLNATPDNKDDKDNNNLLV